MPSLPAAWGYAPARDRALGVCPAGNTAPPCHNCRYRLLLRAATAALVSQRAAALPTNPPPLADRLPLILALLAGAAAVLGSVQQLLRRNSTGASPPAACGPEYPRALARRPSMAMLRAVLLVFCTPLADARHAGGKFETTRLSSSNDSTVDSPPTVNMVDPRDDKNIWVTWRSPTTQLISFSPDRLAIARSKLEANTSLGKPYVRRTNQFVIQQRMCSLEAGGQAETCYAEPFSTYGMPPKNERMYRLFRKSSLGGFSKKGLSIMLKGWPPPFDKRSALEQLAYSNFGWGPLEPVEAWGGAYCKTVVPGHCATLDEIVAAENACNNHRAVRASTALPSVVAKAPEAENWDDIIYNDAEHAETVLGVPNGSCHWVPEYNLRPLIQPVVAEQTWLDRLGVPQWTLSTKHPDYGALSSSTMHPDSFSEDLFSPGEWDYSFEICAIETGCSAEDDSCINVFSLALLSDDTQDNGGPVCVPTR